MIYAKEDIRTAFRQACTKNCEFDALETVARELGLAPDVVAEIVAKPQEVAAA
ncbi:MAG: hypothetical protein IV107_16530 [Paucibacter sp.]|nr:hypothetical protein [Roseateles sp.]